MAGRKTTKVEDEVKNEVLEQKAEETVTAEAEVAEDAKAEAETASEPEGAPVEAETTDEAPEEGETVNTEAEAEAAEPNADEIIDSETKELINEVESVGETLNSEVLHGTDAEEAISKELEHVEELEKKITKKINESAKNIKTVRNDQFRNFWCGVSDGWNN